VDSFPSEISAKLVGERVLRALSQLVPRQPSDADRAEVAVGLVPLREVRLALRDPEHGHNALVAVVGGVAPKRVAVQNDLVVGNVTGLALAGADLGVPLLVVDAKSEGRVGLDLRVGCDQAPASPITRTRSAEP